MARKDQPAWKDVMSRQGLDDMTLLSKITNEEISKNLKERFDNQIIYVCVLASCHMTLSRGCGARGRGDSGLSTWWLLALQGQLHAATCVRFGHCWSTLSKRNKATTLQPGHIVSSK
jgi:hypothetical protein